MNAKKPAGELPSRSANAPSAMENLVSRTITGVGLVLALNTGVACDATPNHIDRSFCPECKYEGETKLGLANGSGIATSGSFRYEGNWKDGKPHGRGKLTSSNTYFYEGEWENGKENGEGTSSEHWGDSSYSNIAYKYVGTFKNGKPNGYGTRTSADGSSISGMWRDGEFVKRLYEDKKGND